MLIKQVKPFGNGAQILVPKEWIGKEVIINIKNKTLENIKDEVLSNMTHLNNVACIVLLGSYARKENLPESDIDIAIFCAEKINFNLNNYHIILVNINNLEKEINLNPALFKSILDEGIPILNSSFLKNIKIKNIYIKKFKDECYKHYLMNKEFLELDKKQNSLSLSVVYSIMLRLRALFILNNKYSYKTFRDFLMKNHINFDSLYIIYKDIRDNKKIENNINLNEIEDANEFLLKQLK